MHVMVPRGYSVDYFVEGGRSRTGRMLAPRPGMLSMTVRSFLRDHRKPIVFVPVYIGYEKVMEGRSYLGELRSEEHTSELQSRPHLVCRLLLEKKKQHETI